MPITRRCWIRHAAALLATVGWLPSLATRAHADERKAPSAAGGGTLRSAEPFGAPSLDPAGAVTSYIVQLGLGEALMRITPQGTLAPWLAPRAPPTGHRSRVGRRVAAVGDGRG